MTFKEIFVCSICVVSIKPPALSKTTEHINGTTCSEAKLQFLGIEPFLEALRTIGFYSHDEHSIKAGL